VPSSLAGPGEWMSFEEDCGDGREERDGKREQNSEFEGP